MISSQFRDHSLSTTGIVQRFTLWLSAPFFLLYASKSTFGLPFHSFLLFFRDSKFSAFNHYIWPKAQLEYAPDLSRPHSLIVTTK